VPFLPYVTEEIYRTLFAAAEGRASIHQESWPVADERWEDEQAEAIGEMLVEIATAVRRYKSEANLPLSTELARLQLATGDSALAQALCAASSDLNSITRARKIEVSERLSSDLEVVKADGDTRIALMRS